MKSLKEFLADNNLFFECPEIVEGEGVLQNSPKVLASATPVRRIVLICDKIFADTGDELQLLLEKEKFAVKRVNASVCSRISSAQEIDKSCADYSVFAALGGGTLCDAVKLVAARREGQVALFPTTLSTEAYYTDTSQFVLENRTVRSKLADFVFADMNILALNDRRFTAAGYGRLLSLYERLFECKYDALINGKYLPPFTDALLREMNAFFMSDTKGPDFLTDLSRALQKAAVCFNALPPEWDTLDNLISVSQGTSLQGQNGPLAAYVKLNLYSCILEHPAVDCLLPPDRTKSRKLLRKYFSEPALKDEEPSIVSDYFKSAHILDEYRADMYNLIENMHFQDYVRTWRRLYPDAGYWIKDYIGSAKLLRLMSIAAECDCGFVHDIKLRGCLENFI